MRVTIFLLALAGIPLQAQTSATDQIVQAFQQWKGGQPRAAIATLEPILQPEVNGITDTDLGVAWNVLGSSYMNLEMYEQARGAFQHAMEKLRSIPAAQAEYASTLDDLGTLEGAMGEDDSAKALCEKARRIYAALGNSAGIAIASADLAVIAYAHKDFKAARRALQTALQQAQHTTALENDDIAAIDSLKGALALHDGRTDEAISDIQDAIDLWTRAHGPGYFLAGAGYLLRAQAFAKTGDYARAIADAQRAIAIAGVAVGRNSVAYLSTETTYAQILRASGAKDEASRIEKEAGSALADLQSRRCSGCTMDVSGFR